MHFSYPSQRFQDWVSQCCCIATGRRIEPNAVPWLMGPFGNVDVIEDRYVADLAAHEGLEIQKNRPGFGIVESMDAVLADRKARANLDPQVRHFYEHTSEYEFEVWTQWCQFYRPFAGLLSRLYSKRLQQLNLPMSPLDTSRGIQSQIYKLVDPSSGDVRYTIWYRHLKSTKQVIYSGIYGSCTTPDGKSCLKVVFPLPRGNATVVMNVHVSEDGALSLVSKGAKFGDAGFYFLLTNSKDRYFAKYIPTLNETIRVFVDEEGVLRADHVVNMCSTKALHLHYKIVKARTTS